MQLQDILKKNGGIANALLGLWGVLWIIAGTVHIAWAFCPNVNRLFLVSGLGGVAIGIAIIYRYKHVKNKKKNRAMTKETSKNNK